VRVGVVGAGPAGCLTAYHLARQGARVTLFDASHPREKPCGGGLTGKALDRLPAGTPDDPLPARHVSSCRFESGEGRAAETALARPVAVASRRELDAWLLRRARDAGAAHVEERVVDVGDGALLRLRSGEERRFDVVVGADGASSCVRRARLGPLDPGRLMMAAGWLAPGTAPMLVRFTPELEGYLWLFPRPNHVGVGLCAPLGRRPTRELLHRLEMEVARSFPALLDPEAPRYAHLIPSPSADERSLGEAGGEDWALVGDAAALADPITGEGIYYALRSAELLAEILCRDGTPRRYPERLIEELGGELLAAARIRPRFYAPGFTARLVRYAERSPAIREVLGELVLGHQGYRGLKRRLLRTAPRFFLDSALAIMSS
jgi:geranylgeranyl reductase family protein